MLYLLHGERFEEARLKAGELVQSLEKKKPDAALFKFDADKWDPVFFEELVGSQGLFERKYIVFLNTVFSDKTIKEFILDRVKEIAESENVFIFLEGKLDKAALGKLEKHAAKVQMFGAGAGSEKAAAKNRPEFNIFSLTDSFGRRDKKSLWVLYRKALAADAAPEEIHGILFWQLKTMIVASKSSTAKDAGLAPFVFSKAQGFLRNFKNDELIGLSKKMVSLYADARRGAFELEIGLEQFVLSI